MLIIVRDPVRPISLVWLEPDYYIRYLYFIYFNVCMQSIYLILEHDADETKVLLTGSLSVPT